MKPPRNQAKAAQASPRREPSESEPGPPPPTRPHIDIEEAARRGWLGEARGPHGRLGFLAPVVQMEATKARWELPSVPLGFHEAAWGEVPAGAGTAARL